MHSISYDSAPDESEKMNKTWAKIEFVSSLIVESNMKIALDDVERFAGSLFVIAQVPVAPKEWQTVSLVPR